MQVLMLFSQGMRCVHRIRLITARNTCTAEVCAHPSRVVSRPPVLPPANSGCSNETSYIVRSRVCASTGEVPYMQAS